MRMRIGEGMKLVAILAVGLGIAQWVYRRTGPAGPLSIVSRLLNQIDFISVRGVPIVAGLTLATACVAWVERIGRRPRRPWGVGRWSASAGALYLFLLFLKYLVVNLGRHFVWGLEHGLDEFGDDLINWVIVAISEDLNLRSSLVIIACWSSAKLAGWKGDPEPDAVEWFGRLLFFATCFITIGCSLAIEFLQ